MTRSREGHLGRPLIADQTNPPRRTLAPGLLRNWGSDDRTRLPVPGVRWLARMESRARMEVFMADAMEGVGYKSNRSGDGVTVLVSGPDRPIITLVRPKAEIFRGQVDRVESWAALRAERATEILTQLGPQFPYWASLVPLNGVQSPFAVELVLVALELAANVVQKVKFDCACPRPSDHSPRIQPMFDNPGFFAWPSGHATQAFMVAELLSALSLPIGSTATVETWRELREQLLRQAERIATNRVVAGVHFPCDSEAGCELGLRLAQHLIARCTALPPDKSNDTFDVNNQADAAVRDFAFKTHVDRQSHFTMGKDLAQLAKSLQPMPFSEADDRRSALQWLWKQAHDEWHRPGRL